MAGGGDVPPPPVGAKNVVVNEGTGVEKVKRRERIKNQIRSMYHTFNTNYVINLIRFDRIAFHSIAVHHMETVDFSRTTCHSNIHVVECSLLLGKIQIQNNSISCTIRLFAPVGLWQGKFVTYSLHEPDL